jgi:uncharacterized protein (DUF58 family)
VETSRGAEQFTRFLETLARVELTDGLTFSQLVLETASRITRNATVVAILTSVTPETAVALGNLRRRGFAVTALVNTFEERDYAEAAGMLAAEHIESRQLIDEQGVSTICGEYALR